MKNNGILQNVILQEVHKQISFWLRLEPESIDLIGEYVSLSFSCLNNPDLHYQYLYSVDEISRVLVDVEKVGVSAIAPIARDLAWEFNLHPFKH